MNLSDLIDLIVLFWLNYSGKKNSKPPKNKQIHRIYLLKMANFSLLFQTVFNNAHIQQLLAVKTNSEDVV